MKKTWNSELNELQIGNPQEAAAELQVVVLWVVRCIRQPLTSMLRQELCAFCRCRGITWGLAATPGTITAILLWCMLNAHQMLTRCSPDAHQMWKPKLFRSRASAFPCIDSPSCHPCSLLSLRTSPFERICTWLCGAVFERLWLNAISRMSFSLSLR